MKQLKAKIITVARGLAVICLCYCATFYESIASSVYGAPKRWPEIYRANAGSLGVAAK